MREEYHSALGRTAKNACIEPCSLCLATLLFIPMPSLTSTSLPPKMSLHLNKCFSLTLCPDHFMHIVYYGNSAAPITVY